MDATQRTVINNNYEVIIGRVLRAHRITTFLLRRTISGKNTQNLCHLVSTSFRRFRVFLFEAPVARDGGVIRRALRLVGHESATLLSSLPPPFEQPRKYKQSREAPEYSR